jgi:hypothetical protein
METEARRPGENISVRDGLERMADSVTRPAFSVSALLSLALGLLSLWLHFFAALPALGLGLIALRQINRSDGRISGRWLCVAGMVLGAVMLIVDVLALGASVIALLRNKSSRVECENNLRMIGMATTEYLTDHKSFPPGTVRNVALPPEDRLSWFVAILPYYSDMEARRRRANREDTVYFAIDSGIDRKLVWDAPSNRDATDSYIRAFICPGHPFFEETPKPGTTYYVGISGLSVGAATLPSDDPRCGIFGYDRMTSPEEITRGESYTMMVCETGNSPGPWARGGFSTVRGVDPQDLPFSGAERPFGGLHKGLTNILMADGSLFIFRDDGLPKTFADMALIRAEAVEVPKQ